MRCSACGHDNPAGSLFCNACGARVGGAAPAPQAYTPPHLSEQILTSRAALVGERKQVTVLFADLKASMELLGGRDPEEARALIDPVLERMMEAVHRYEGTVNQVMGDGIMALFGAPLAHEDHAVRACYAALRMQETVARYAADLERREGLVVRIRVGLNSGEVVVRSIGNDLHMDYTAVGQTTHLAARMEQMAEPGSILITSSTLRLAEAAIGVRALGSRPVRGLDTLVEVYELLSAVPVRSVLKTAVAQNRSRFVGRQAELARLAAIATEAARGHGQIVALSGEPGVGKTRLVCEFVQAPHTRDWQVLECRALSYETSAAWAPVVHFLQRYLDLDARDGVAEIAEKVAGKLLALDASFAELIPPIVALLGVLPEHDAWYGLDTLERRRLALDALTRLVLKESERHPLMFVFEDLQWVDRETRAFIERLVERVVSARLMLLLDYRPEFAHEWTGLPGFTEIVLGPLAPEVAHELLDKMLGSDRDLAGLKELLVERSRGNAFFLEEMVHTLVDTRALVQEPGRYRLTRDLAALEIPATVQAVVAARIDHLALDEKLLLQSAAVVGMDVPAPLLHPLTELTIQELESALARLVSARFLETTTLYPDVEYRFRHPLTREVASASLLRERRRTLHARIVEVIETRYGTQLSSWIDQLARHASGGELWSKAVTYNRQAGARAAGHAANVDAVEAYQAALHALARLPQARETIEAAIDIRLDLVAPLLQLGRLDDVLTMSREAESRAEELGDNGRLARVYAHLVNYHYLRAETAAAIDYGHRYLEVVRSTGDAALQGLGRQYIGQSHHLRGEHAAAEEVLRANLTLDPDRNPTSYIASCGWLAWSLAERGDFESAYATLDRAHRTAERLGHAYGQAIAWGVAGLVALGRGHLMRAVPPLWRSLELTERKQLTVWQPIPSSLLGLAFVRLGHVPEGLRLLEHSLALSRRLGVRAYLARWTLNAAEGYLADRQLSRAVTTAHEALTLARAGGERAHEAYAQQLLGDLAEDQSSYEEALSLAEVLGLRPLAASVHWRLHRLHARYGRRAEAERYGAVAARQASELGLQPWPEWPAENGHVRRVVVVARSNADLYAFLAKELAGAHRITVVMDRRQAQQPERGGERRRQGQVDEDLRDWQLAMAAQAQDNGGG